MRRDFISVQTSGRMLVELTSTAQQFVRESSHSQGLLHIFVHHTSASLLITENADPDVLVDLERYFERLVPDGASYFSHTDEGVDDMSAHIRSALTQTSLMIPVEDGRLSLGVWQGIFLWEHRFGTKKRQITLTLLN